MQATVGLWIDHRKTVIAVMSNRGEETMVIESNVERAAGTGCRFPFDDPL